MPLLFRVANIQQRDKPGSKKTSFLTANTANLLSLRTLFLFSNWISDNILAFAVKPYGIIGGYMQLVIALVFLGALAAAPPGLY